MLGIVFNLDDGSNAVIKTGDDRLYLVTDYKPSDKIGIIVNKKLKSTPARWDRLKILSALYEVCELKRGLKFAIRCTEEKKCIDNIRDKKLKKIVDLVNKMVESNFEAEYIIELAETVKKINEEVKNDKFFQKTS